MSAISRFFDQSFRIPKPVLTEHNLLDQTGRVAIVTGGYAGVGYELSKILYQRNATVYVAARSESKYNERSAQIKAACPGSKGKLEYLQLDLGDLSTIKATAEDFGKREQRLDVLVNNAGVMHTPSDAKTPQGHELQLGTNCLGAFLLTKLLYPVLQKTAATSPPGSVRVLWAGSLGTDVQSPKGGVTFATSADGTAIPDPKGKHTLVVYAMTKAANVFLASQYATRHPLSEGGKGVVHLSFNPGNLATELGRHTSGFFFKVVVQYLLVYPAIYGAYTELFAGWSEEGGKAEKNGGYVIPWGRFSDVRKDVQAEVDKGEKEGEGKAVQTWEWCERETKTYL